METGGRQESRQEVVRKWNRKFCRTLAAGEPLPAFFADTGEAVTCHDTRGSVLAGVRQAAAVLRCGVKGTALETDSEASSQKCSARLLAAHLCYR